MLRFQTGVIFKRQNLLGDPRSVLKWTMPSKSWDLRLLPDWYWWYLEQSAISAICGQVEFGRIVGIQSALVPAVRSSDQGVVSCVVSFDPCAEYGINFLNIFQQQGK